MLLEMKAIKTNFKLTTPVLFLTFNRLDTVKQVFEEIKKAKPKQLFLASDGPRENKPEEKKIVEEVRKYILDNIDWKCEVKTLFREKNLGCKYAVSGAIDWFFKNVEQGIVLEDDCLPSQSFFRFCQEMLEKYKNQEKIYHINGTNIDIVSNINESYFFSSIPNVWGWATWRRAWNNYDVEIKEWPRYNSYFGVERLGYKGFFTILKSWRLFHLTYNKKIDTWDYQWDFILKKNKKLCIVPKVNMITNIGLGGGTHTINYGEDKSYKRNNIKFPLKHSDKMINDKGYFDRYVKKYRVNFLKKGVEWFFYKLGR